jgi:uncharacterized protein YndB with AHSA1/START domain
VAARNNLAVSPVQEPEDRTLVITRVFKAPRTLVFEAWTDPKAVVKWMGPRSHPAVHVEQDLRPGGAWRICLRPNDGGRDLWQGGIFHEVVPPERLIFSFAWDQEDGSKGLETLISITLIEHEGKTTMTFRQSVFDTMARRDSHRGGWSGSFDRLEEALAKA